MDAKLACHELVTGRYRGKWGIYKPDLTGKTVIVRYDGIYAICGNGLKLFCLPDGTLSRVKPHNDESLEDLKIRVQARYKDIDRRAQRKKRDRSGAGFHLSVLPDDRFVISRNGVPWYEGTGGQSEGLAVMEFRRVKRVRI